MCSNSYTFYAYFKLNAGAIDLLVTVQGISHCVADYHGLHSDNIKLINRNSYTCTPSWVCSTRRSHGEQLEMSNFIAGHHGHSGVHIEEILLHVHPLGGRMDLVVTKMMFFLPFKKLMIHTYVH